LRSPQADASRLVQALALSAAFDACEHLEDALDALQGEEGHGPVEIHALTQELASNRAELREHFAKSIEHIDAKVPGLGLAGDAMLAAAKGNFGDARELLRQLAAVPGLDPQVRSQAEESIVAAERAACGSLVVPVGPAEARWLHFAESLMAIGTQQALAEATEVLDAVARSGPLDFARTRECVCALASALLRSGDLVSVESFLASTGMDIPIGELFEKAARDCRGRFEWMALAAAAHQARAMKLTEYRPPLHAGPSEPASANSAAHWPTVLPRVAAMLTAELPGVDERRHAWRGVLDTLRPHLFSKDYIELASLLVGEEADDALVQETHAAMRELDDPKEAETFNAAVAALYYSLDEDFDDFNFTSTCASLERLLANPRCNAQLKNTLRQALMDSLLELVRSVRGTENELEAVQNVQVAMLRFGELDEATSTLERAHQSLQGATRPELRRFEDKLNAEFAKRGASPSAAHGPVVPPTDIADVDPALADLVVLVHAGANGAVKERLESVVAGIMHAGAQVRGADPEVGATPEVEAAVGAVLRFLSAVPSAAFESLATMIPTGMHRARFWRCLLLAAWLARSCDSADEMTASLGRSASLVAKGALSAPAVVAVESRLMSTVATELARMPHSDEIDTMQLAAADFASLFPGVAPYAVVLRELERSLRERDYGSIGALIDAAPRLAWDDDEARIVSAALKAMKPAALVLI
jgi:hypothetical protein